MYVNEHKGTCKILDQFLDMLEEKIFSSDDDLFNEAKFRRLSKGIQEIVLQRAHIVVAIPAQISAKVFKVIEKREFLLLDENEVQSPQVPTSLLGAVNTRVVIINGDNRQPGLIAYTTR